MTLNCRFTRWCTGTRTPGEITLIICERLYIQIMYVSAGSSTHPFSRPWLKYPRTRRCRRQRQNRRVRSKSVHVAAETCAHQLDNVQLYSHNPSIRFQCTLDGDLRMQSLTVCYISFLFLCFLFECISLTLAIHRIAPTIVEPSVAQTLTQTQTHLHTPSLSSLLIVHFCISL